MSVSPCNHSLCLALRLLAFAQVVQGCGGSCATLWYFWFGIFLALMIGFILLIVGVNFCLKRHHEKKLITRKFRISPQYNASSDDAKLPKDSTHDSQAQEVEKGDLQDMDDHQHQSSSEDDTASNSSSASVVSDVVSLPDNEGKVATHRHFRAFSPRMAAFGSPTHGAAKDETFPRYVPQTGDQTSRSEEIKSEHVSYDRPTEHRHSVSGVRFKPRPLSPSASFGGSGELGLNRTLNLSSSGPILVVETPRIDEKEEMT